MKTDRHFRIFPHHRGSALLLVLYAFCSAAQVAAGGLNYSHSYAVVVGITNYLHANVYSPLPFCQKDAMDLGRFLESQAFIVTQVYNKDATMTGIKTAIQNVARLLERNDRVLVFFSGHGVSEKLGDERFGYIVPYEGTENTATLLSMGDLRELSSKLGNAKHQLFILDCCFAGLIATKDSTAWDKGYPGYIERLVEQDAREFIVAGGKDQRVRAEGPKGCSFFTGYLLEALVEGKADLYPDGFITFGELASYLTQRASSDDQVPVSGNLPRHGDGQFVFVSPNGSKTERAVVPLPVSDFKGKADSSHGIMRLSADADGGIFLNEKYFDYIQKDEVKEYLHLSEGNLVVKFWSRDNIVLTKIVQVRNGQITPVSFSVNQASKPGPPGKIRFVGYEGEIYLNNVLLGTASEKKPAEFTLEVGNHTVEVHTQTKVYTEKLSITKDNVTVLTKSLLPPWGLRMGTN